MPRTRISSISVVKDDLDIGSGKEGQGHPAELCCALCRVTMLPNAHRLVSDLTSVSLTSEECSCSQEENFFMILEISIQECPRKHELSKLWFLNVVPSNDSGGVLSLKLVTQSLLKLRCPQSMNPWAVTFWSSVLWGRWDRFRDHIQFHVRATDRNHPSLRWL